MYRTLTSLYWIRKRRTASLLCGIDQRTRADVFDFLVTVGVSGRTAPRPGIAPSAEVLPEGCGETEKNENNKK